MRDDWFSRLTGFNEGPYSTTRELLEVNGTTLRSKVNDRSFCIGQFEMPSLADLRLRVQAAELAEGQHAARLEEAQADEALLAPLHAYMGEFEVARDYRIVTDERCKAGIYIQGFSQASHGLSDTLLSVLPIRADEIAASLYEHDRSRGKGRSVQDLLLATAS